MGKKNEKKKKSSYSEIFIRGQMIQLKKKNSSPSSLMYNGNVILIICLAKQYFIKIYLHLSHFVIHIVLKITLT